MGKTGRICNESQNFQSKPRMTHIVYFICVFLAMWYMCNNVHLNTVSGTAYWAGSYNILDTTF